MNTSFLVLFWMKFGCLKPTETDYNKIMFAIILGKLEFESAYHKTETDPQKSLISG